MRVADAIKTRRSVRAFLSDPVPDEVIEDILRVAAHAPSGNNVQPWRVYVVRGAAKEALSAEVLHAREHAPRAEPEFRSTPQPLPEPYKQRSRENGIALYTLLGIGKGDREGHHRQQRRNYIFFDAPVGLFFFIDRVLELGSWLDCGMFIQNVMLAARGHGLHSCPQGAWRNFHPIVRRRVGAGPDEVLLCGMSLGFADPRAPVNALEVPREPLEQLVRWVEPREGGAPPQPTRSEDEDQGKTGAPRARSRPHQDMPQG